MEPICLGAYVFKPSLVEMYKVEDVDGSPSPEYVVTVYLKNGQTIVESVEGEDAIEEINETLFNALKEKENG